MAKKTAAKNDKAGTAESTDQAPDEHPRISDYEAEGAILQLKGLFGVMADMGCGADTQVAADDLGMLANLASDRLAILESRFFG